MFVWLNPLYQMKNLNILALSVVSCLLAGCTTSHSTYSKSDFYKAHPSPPLELVFGSEPSVSTPLPAQVAAAPQAAVQPAPSRSSTPRRATAGKRVDSEGFTVIFDGDWQGWIINEQPQAWKIVNREAFRASGPRSHAFYIGDPVPFKDFELKAEVKTQANSNGGIYFHTRYQDTGWPKYGFETQVNVSHGDWKKTGSIYDVVNVRETPAQDEKWWTQHIIVRGNRVIVKIDDQVVVDYTEPAGHQAGADFTRKLDEGTFALQCHDPEGVVFYRNIRVKRL
jgi:hypothetical protein